MSRSGRGLARDSGKHRTHQAAMRPPAGRSPALRARAGATASTWPRPWGVLEQRARETAVYRDRRARNEIARVAAQKDCNAFEVSGHAPALGRRAVDNLVMQRRDDLPR